MVKYFLERREYKKNLNILFSFVVYCNSQRRKQSAVSLKFASFVSFSLKICFLKIYFLKQRLIVASFLIS